MEKRKALMEIRLGMDAQNMNVLNTMVLLRLFQHTGATTSFTNWHHATRWMSIPAVQQ